MEPGRLNRLFHPLSIAVFGGQWAANVVEQCLQMGFSGEIWPVHPQRKEIHGLACYRSVEDLPGAPDAAFVGVNRELTIDIVRALKECGAGGAVCFASGFLESEDPRGSELQARLVEAAADMPVIGPNCYGFINYLDGVPLWPDQHGGRRCGKGVAILTQSSNIAVNMTMQRRGLPIAFMVTAGNQAQTKLSEIAVALLDDPRVTALGLHIEGIGDVQSFEALAARAKTVGKPVIALKVGRSEQAKAQTLTHTASLAGSEAGALAFLERLGIPAVRSITVFLETLKLLHVHGPLAGNRLASISCSGGEASLMADLAVGRAVSFPALAPKQATRLNAVLGPHVTIANPLDYHTYVWGRPEELTETFTAMLDGPLDLAMLVLDWPRADRCAATGWDVALKAIRAAAIATGTRTAIVASLPENMPESLADELVSGGIAPLCGMEEAVLAAEAAFLAGKGLERPLPAPALLSVSISTHTETPSEAEAKAALAAHGLSVPRGFVCAGTPEMRSAARGIGYPVVLKALGIAHKSESGAVAVGIENEAELIAAACGMQSFASSFLVEEMVTGAVCELIVGVVRDPAHGFVLTLGAGGILAELIRDTASLILPASDAEIAAKLENLQVHRLLTAYRGKPGGDIRAVIDAVQAVAAYAASERSRLLELDVNPLIVTDRGAVAADALIRLAILEYRQTKEAAA